MPQNGCLPAAPRHSAGHQAAHHANYHHVAHHAVHHAAGVGHIGAFGANNPGLIHALVRHIPLKVKKAAVLASACLVTPLTIAHLAADPPKPQDPVAFERQLDPSATAVPEPSSLFVMVIGVGAVVYLARRRASAAAL
jgi:hypothetical protein